MNTDAAERMLEEMQQRFPGLTLELATQTLLAESLKTCQTIMDLTKLPVNPKVLDQLLQSGLIDRKEWERLMTMLDPKPI